jgi:uridine phosphorylase
MARQEIVNPYVKQLEVDHLHHLGLDSSMDLKQIFGDVRFVLMGGSPERAENFARQANKDLELNIPEEEIKPLGRTERCSLYKVGPVISLSHGIGMPSFLIFLHEITKLVQHAECEDVKFIRVGTSGGLGVEPGTVIVTNQALNGKLEPAFEQIVLGKTVRHKTKLNKEMAKAIFEQKGELPVIRANTMGTDDFYEGQARLDGAIIPDYSIVDRFVFFDEAYRKGVRNIEMECNAFAAFCLRAKIPAAVVCTTILNRLESEEPTSTIEELNKFSTDAQSLVLRYIKKELGKNGN